MHQIEFYEYTNKNLVICDVYLCIHQQKQFLDKTNTRKMVVKVKILHIEETLSYAYLYIFCL